jgi:hypothetical protein
VIAISLAVAFRRAGLAVQFTAVTNNEFPEIARGYIDVITVPPEPHLFLVADRQTRLWRALRKTRPDLLIVLGSWLPVYALLPELDCVKVLLVRQTNEPFLHARIGAAEEIHINPEDYDLALSCEPNFNLPGFQAIHPIIIRNRDEILSREEARRRLGVPDGKKLAVIARNGYEGELEELLARHGGAQTPAAPNDTPAAGQKTPAGEWHRLVTTNKDGGGIFPLADYAAAIDLLISGGGYSTFYESRYFGIPAELESFPRNAEDISWRLETNADYTFDVNGADEFVRTVRRLL